MISKIVVNKPIIKPCTVMEGRKDKVIDRRIEGKAGLMIAYSKQHTKNGQFLKNQTHYNMINLKSMAICTK